MIRLKPKANWRQFRKDNVGTWYQWGDLRVCVGDLEQEGHWHISISHPYRYPSWDEIYTARYDFCPHDIVHPNCFHVHQLQSQELPAGLITF
jgi:hypothetical protein